ncbi:MAG: CBS domain-containing protein [Myxococcota bacterium]
MLVRDLMLVKVYSCRESDRAIDCARLMRDEKIGFVPVLNENDQLIGVVTDRDLALRLVAADLPASTPVSRIMTRTPLLSVRPDDDLQLLERKMSEERRSRAVVIDREGRLAGVVSLSDVVAAEPSPQRAAQLLKDIASREAVTVLRQ